MTRSSLLGATAWFCLMSGAAAAQVSVPLPSASRAPAPQPPAPTSPQSAPVPLPGSPKRDIDSLPTVGQTDASALPIGKYGRPDINPYDRDMDLTVPLMFKQRSLGDMPVRLTFDDRLLLERKAFLGLIGSLLNAKARTQLLTTQPSKDRLESDDLRQQGISFQYDPSNLAVVVLTIDPAQREMESVFAAPSGISEAPDLMPASVAAFLNINVLQSYVWTGIGNGPPTVALNGAIRAAGIVLEGDGQFGRDGFTGPYRFDRNYARLVYDEAGQYRRWYLGDLSPETRGQQGYVQMGGIGVSRQRQRFDPFRSSVLQGNRQLLLQQDSSVRILRNGVLYRELRLEAGSYDFSSLPLLAGSNDVQIEIRDNAGSVRSISYSQYLDPIDLTPGDYEYSAYIGPTSNSFGRSPVYSGPVAFSGFFRKAFIGAPAVGVGLQANAHVQALTGQTQFVLPGGSRLLFDGGVSRSRRAGAGYSIGVGFDHVIDRGGLVDSASIRADYLSPRYAFLSSPEAENSNAATVSAQYTHQFNQRMSAILSANYLKGRNRNDSYRIGASANYRLNREFTVRGGIDYSRVQSAFGRGRGIGLNIALVYQPSFNDRFEARHDGSAGDTSLTYMHSSSSRIGSLGYGAVLNRNDSAVLAQGYADYIGNRFDATITHASYGPNFSGFGNTNVTALRAGASIAFADGVLGIGRRVNDSFALLYPHQNLKGRSVVAGQSLANNDYMSKSGTFGAAVNGYLASYVTQPIQYDVENPPPGYDIGPGTARVNPPYHSGYKLKIGTDAFASAAGVLSFPDGKPVALIGGRVIAKDGKDKEPLPFFTNSVGRFAIANLRPGAEYRVEIGQGTGGFEFRVPLDTTGLVNLNTITLKPAN